MNAALTRILLATVVAALPLATLAASITTTRHNLSVSGPGPIKSTSETEICIFCHAPHSTRQDTPFLWNRSDSTANYTTYQSSTMFANAGQPTGASKLCLSCHDGTIALGLVLTRSTEIPFAGGVRFLSPGDTRLGTDISDDHPVSFVYDQVVATGKGEMASPSSLTGPVKLDANGELQCTACHDPHDDTNGKFLVAHNQFSALCTACHQRTNWTTSSHSTSAATWSGAGTDPWQHTTFTTVNDNGCENCHRPHTAGGHARLLNFPIEEDNCLVCHSGNVAQKNIENELLKATGHKVQDFNGVHDAAEDFSGPVGNHVECVDCHNPHQNDATTASAPNVPGPLRGASGITSSGATTASVGFAYEVCLKCHADNNVLTATPFPRVYTQLNTRLEFALSAASFHPVEGPGKNSNSPSLLSPYTTSSVIYCTDCHNNDQGPGNGGGGPNGPHGSNNDHLLERNYTTLDNTNESSTAYALCYKCHSRTSILNDQSFKEHNKHIRGEGAPCSVCHDGHGVSSSQGNTTNNSHLINFRTDIVTPNSNNGRLEFVDQGTFRGECSLRCHGKNHDRWNY